MPPDGARASMNEQMVTSEKQPQRPKTLRNTHTHMSGLPADLLLDIFMILKAASPHHRLGPWHRANLVCRHWRRVAVGAPILWNELPTDNHDFTLLMLERTRMADLHIFMDNETSTQTATAILDHIGRIRSLYIDQNLEALQNIQDLLLGLDLPAPRLEALRIMSDEYIPNPRFLLSIGLRRLLVQLRFLQLSRIRYEWDILPLPKLTQLFLDCYTKGVTAISPKKLLKTLCQMQQLEVLSISLSHILHEDRSSIDDPQFTSLPRLSRLTVLYEISDDLNYILSCLSLPRLAYISINCDDPTDEDVADYSRTIEAFGTLINNGAFEGGLRYLSLYKDQFMLSYFDERTHRYPSPRVQLCLPNPFLEGITRLIEEVPSGIVNMTHGKLSSLTHAEISVASNAQEVLQLLGSLPSLKSIAIHNALLAQLTNAVTIPSGYQQDALPPFPKLESIIWYGVTASSHELLQFRECLILRRDHGFPVLEMRLAYSVRIPRSEVALLGEVVVDLITEL